MKNKIQLRWEIFTKNTFNKKTEITGKMEISMSETHCLSEIIGLFIVTILYKRFIILNKYIDP